MLAAAFAALAVAVPAAQAVPIVSTFDKGIMTLGDLGDQEVVDASAPAVLTGDFNPTSGRFTIPTSGLKFPTKSSDVMGLATAEVTLSLNEPANGTYDPNTGAMSADTNLRALIKLKGAVNGTCEISPLPLQLSTGASFAGEKAVHSGAPFGSDGRGALAGPWEVLPPARDIEGTQCAGLVDSLSNGKPGGIWLAGATKVYKDGETPPDPKPDPDPDPDPKPGVKKPALALTVKPKALSRVKRGGKVSYRITVRNKGEAAASNVRVCVTAPKKHFKAPACLKIAKLAQAKAVTRTLKLSATGKAARKKHRITFSVKATGVKAKNARVQIAVR